MNTEAEQFFLCPYCASRNSILIDFSGGESQEFVNDCEACCRPILIRLKIDGEEIINFAAEKENE